MKRSAWLAVLLFTLPAAAEEPKKSKPAKAPDAGAPTAEAAAPDAGTKPLAPAAPVDLPSAAEAKKVLEYYYRGREQGPLLVELVPCLKVDNTTGPSKSDCLEPVTGPVKKGTTVNAWTLWIVPDGGNYDDVIIQWSLEGQVRSTTDVKLVPAFRSRTWRPSALHKVGKWEIKILRGADTLAQATVMVE